MSSPGYIVRPEYLRLAQEKADPGQRVAIEELFAPVAVLDGLERTFVSRLEEARSATGVPMPKLSRAAREAVDSSTDADREVHRLLHRRCRRADSAVDVFRELVEVAKQDLELSELTDEAEDVPAKQIVGEINAAKRAMLASLERFIDRFD